MQFCQGLYAIVSRLSPDETIFIVFADIEEIRWSFFRPLAADYFISDAFPSLISALSFRSVFHCWQAGCRFSTRTPELASYFFISSCLPPLSTPNSNFTSRRFFCRRESPVQHTPSEAQRCHFARAGPDTSFVRPRRRILYRAWRVFWFHNDTPDSAFFFHLPDILQARSSFAFARGYIKRRHMLRQATSRRLVFAIFVTRFPHGSARAQPPVIFRRRAHARFARRQRMFEFHQASDIAARTALSVRPSPPRHRLVAVFFRRYSEPASVLPGSRLSHCCSSRPRL